MGAWLVVLQVVKARVFERTSELYKVGRTEGARGRHDVGNILTYKKEKGRNRTENNQNN